MTPPATRPRDHLRLVHSTGEAQTRRTLIDAPTIGQLRTAWAAHLIDRGMPPPDQTD